MCEYLSHVRHILQQSRTLALEDHPAHGHCIRHHALRQRWSEHYEMKGVIGLLQKSRAPKWKVNGKLCLGDIGGVGDVTSKTENHMEKQMENDMDYPE